MAPGIDLAVLKLDDHQFFDILTDNGVRARGSPDTLKIWNVKGSAAGRTVAQ